MKRKNIRLWLEFLVENNLLYRNHPINNYLLNELPNNGSVLNFLTTRDEEENLDNEEKSSDEPDNVCKLQLGPEQWEANGSKNLVDTNFLGPTNINNVETEEEK